MAKISCGSVIRRLGATNDPGTAGCLVQFPDDTQKLFWLTAGHVLVGRTAKRFDPVEAKDLPGQTIGVLFGWTSLDGPTTTDAAIVQVDPELVLPEIDVLGAPKGTNLNPQVGSKLTVFAMGQKRSGTIKQIGVDVPIRRVGPDFEQSITYINQILCESFSVDGCNGAIAVDDDERVVGMVVAGDSSTFTLVTPVDALLSHPDWGKGPPLEIMASVPPAAKAPPSPLAVPSAPPNLRRESTPFVSARVPSPRMVIYTDATGDELVREAGSRSWRNNNPGNIVKGSFAEEHGSIGGDDRFAIFPDESTGRSAIVSLLSNRPYSDLTLAQAINRYAPPDENNTAGYVKFVVENSSVRTDDVLSTLNQTKFDEIADAIKKIEGWKDGEESPNRPAAVQGGGPAVPVSSAATAAQDWMQIATAEAALPEHDRSQWPGEEANPRILEYFRVASPSFDARSQGGDEVDWCAAFVNYCLEKAGYRGTGHPGARSFYWNKGNHFLKLDEPKYGCIAVFRDPPFSDPNWETGSGHVGFIVDSNSTEVELLGGNQGHTVKKVRYNIKPANTISRRIEAYMMPVKN